MKRFMKVTDGKTGKVVLLNLDSITMVSENEDGTTRFVLNDDDVFYKTKDMFVDVCENLISKGLL